ncbi:hypothetical protein EDB85DRAFT_2141166 [Lactarius pseudohatsudake]|nr:hypothetical protein EDB85DRAFT_2141166 [Lactarius pseudohatsudake]
MSSTDRSSSPYTRRDRGQEDREMSQNPSSRPSEEPSKPSKKKKTRKKSDDEMTPFVECGRFLMRCVYPFMVVDTLIIVAQEQTSPGCADKYETDKIKDRYEGYAAAALNFSEALQKRLSWGDICVPDINTALAQGMRAGRSTDIHRLKSNTGRLASKTDTPLALVGETKSDCGFTNDALGRMLIPIQHLKAYTDNPVETKIRNGLEGYEVTGGDPPAFLYEDPENYDPTNLLSGFMRGYFLPRSAWNGQDGKFDYQDFADMLFQVFKHDDDWTEQTIRWWNVELFGNENGLRSAGSYRGATSGFLAMVKDQSKDHRAEKEVPEQTSVEEPGPWDKEGSELSDPDARENDQPDALPSPSSPRSQTADVCRATTPSLKTCSRVDEDSDKDDDDITSSMPRSPRKRTTGKRNTGKQRDTTISDGDLDAEVGNGAGTTRSAKRLKLKGPKPPKPVLNKFSPPPRARTATIRPWRRETTASTQRRETTTPTRRHETMASTRRCDTMESTQCHDTTASTQRRDTTASTQRRDNHDIDAAPQHRDIDAAPRHHDIDTAPRHHDSDAALRRHDIDAAQ